MEMGKVFNLICEGTGKRVAVPGEGPEGPLRCLRREGKGTAWLSGGTGKLQRRFLGLSDRNPPAGGRG